jgi:DNA-binding CsgD family transcriptional regulator
VNCQKLMWRPVRAAIPMATTSAVREEEVLKLVAARYSSKEIAGMLVISVTAVERDRLELTRYAIRSGLIEP